MSAQKSSQNKVFRHSFICALREGKTLAAFFAVIVYLGWAFLLVTMGIGMGVAGIIGVSGAAEELEAVGAYGFFQFVGTIDGDNGAAFFILSAVIPMAFFMAMLLFRFGFQKNSANVYRSLGIKAGELFSSRFLAGAVLMCAALLVSFIPILIINLFFVGFNSRMLISGFYLFFSIFACAMTVYAITACVFIRSGNIVEASAFSGLMNAVPAVFGLFINAIIARVPGYVPKGFFAVDEEYRDMHYDYAMKEYSYEWYNHISFARKSIETYGSGDTAINSRYAEEWVFPNLLLLAFWLAVPAVLCFVGMRLLKKHRTENCGTLGKSNGMNFIVSSAIAILAAYYLLTGVKNIGGNFAGTAAAFAAAVAVFILCEILLLRNKKAIAGEMKKIPLFLGVFALMIAVTHVYGVVYTRDIPKAEDIKYIYFQTPTDIDLSEGVYSNYASIGEESSVYEEILNDKSPGGYDEKYEIVRAGAWMANINLPGDIEKILAIHEHCAKQGKVTVENPAYVVFYYQLKNGETFSRRFAVNLGDEETAKVVAGAEDTEWYKKRLEYQLTDETDIEVGGNEYSGYSLTAGIRLISRNALSAKNVMDVMSYEQMWELMAIISDDLQNRTSEQKYFSENGVIGFVSTCPKREMGEKNDDGEFVEYPADSDFYAVKDIYGESIYDWERTELLIPITEDMEGTVKFLKEHDLYKYFSDNGAGNITAVRAKKYVRKPVSNGSAAFLSLRIKEATDVRNYDSSYIGDIGKREGDINSPEQIKELWNLSKAYCLAEGGYIVSFLTDTGDIIMRYLPADEAPDYIK